MLTRTLLAVSLIAMLPAAALAQDAAQPQDPLEQAVMSQWGAAQTLQANVGTEFSRLMMDRRGLMMRNAALTARVAELEKLCGEKCKPEEPKTSEAKPKTPKAAAKAPKPAPEPSSATP